MHSSQLFTTHGVAGGLYDGYGRGTPETLAARSAVVLFRRDPARDRQEGRIHYHGYGIFWPEGDPVAVGLDVLCRHGVRLLGLGRQLACAQETLVELLCFPLDGREDDMTHLPGHRVRRFSLRRQGHHGRLHFLDGTPTDVVFALCRDEDRVLEWIGLSTLRDGQQQWIDLAARPVATY